MSVPEDPDDNPVPAQRPEPRSSAPAEPPEGAGTPTVSQVPRTRTSMAWVGACVAALLVVALIVFMAQNTRRVQVSFLWMSTETPLAIALLIAAVGSIMLTLILGSARILQLRRVVRKQRD